MDVDARIASASRASGALRSSVFNNRHLNIHIKICVFNNVPSVGHLSNVIFSGCPRVSHEMCGSILGVSRSQCWKDHISNVQLLKLWGDPEPLNIKVANRRLEWLGHVVRIESERMLRQLLSGTSTLVARPMVLGAAGKTVQCPTSSPVAYMVAGMQLHGSLGSSGGPCTPQQILVHLLYTVSLGVRLLLSTVLFARGRSRAPRIVPGASALQSVRSQ